MSKDKNSFVAKGCLTVICVAIGVPLLLILLFFVLLHDEPVTLEEMEEIANRELDDQDIQIYMTLLEIGNNHRRDLLDRVTSTDTLSYFNFPLNSPFSNHKLPKKISAICDSLASNLSDYKSATLQISRQKGAVSLHVFRQDNDNYLYIRNKLYFVDSLVQKQQYDHIKEKVIGGRYRYVVEIEDAFNYIDPNNLAPN